MRGFRSGTFERESVPRVLRAFSPKSAVESIQEIELRALREQGKRLLLLDVDNTLLPWREEEIPPATMEWVAEAKALGFDLCLVSNTRNPERLARLAEKLGADTVRDKFKPSRRMFTIALERYQASQDEALTIGDQLLTDILGANRSGIDAIWVRPMAKREFVGTRIVSRRVERMIGTFLYRHFSGDAATPGLFSHSIIQHMIRFALVGGLSTIIDAGLHGMLMLAPLLDGKSVADSVGHAMLGDGNWSAKQVSDAAFGPLKVPTTALAILNSYYWNRKWTFAVEGEVPHGPMIARFFAVALVGLVLSVVVGAYVKRLLHLPVEASWGGATLVATVVVFFWNFFAQRYFTFRGHGR